MTASSADQAAADRLGRPLALRLAQGCEELDHGVAERLRVARQQAVARRRVAPSSGRRRPSQGPAVPLQAAGHGGPGLGARWAAALPLAALVLGLLGLPVLHQHMRARAVTAIDTARLTLPATRDNGRTMSRIATSPYLIDPATLLPQAAPHATDNARSTAP